MLKCNYLKLANEISELKTRVVSGILIILYRLGKKQDACSVFNQLFRQYPKRMYKQEYEKYCTNNP